MLSFALGSATRICAEEAEIHVYSVIKFIARKCSSENPCSVDLQESLFRNLVFAF
jgi:hypothetical protein